MVNVEFVNPFIQSTCNVFKTMVFMEAVRGMPYLKEKTARADISGTIGLAGQTNGVVAVTFEKDVACKITSSMLGEDHNDLNETVQDTIGEIANMVAGGAKSIMAAKGLSFKIAVPSVIVGEDHWISYPAKVPCMVIPFTIKDLNKTFSVEVCLKTNS